MKQILVISGKGGTGKTSVTAALAVLAKKAVLADCDVDAADLHLILRPEVQRREVFRCGHEAVIRAADCTGCGVCAEVCRYDAIEQRGAVMRVRETGCEGCGVCVTACPAGAIDFPESEGGEWFISETRCGPLVHARLRPGAENSGKLVALVREQAEALALEQKMDWVLIDGPPGIGCPVIASLSGVDLAVVVTEPTLSGAHDLARVLDLTAHFRIPTAMIVNKYDLNSAMTDKIEREAAARGACSLGRLAYDDVFTEAQRKGLAVVEYGEGTAASALRIIWERIKEKVKS